MTIKTKFLSTADVEEAVTEVADLARRAGVPAALVGGVAMAVYGSDRLTKDVDFASTSPLPLRGRTKKLSFGGTRGFTTRGVPVDVIVREDEYQSLYADAVEHARDEGLPMLVVTPEHLAALKLAAARDKDDLDLRDLLRRGVVNRRRARSIVKEHLGEYAARDFDSICDEVDWRQRRSQNQPRRRP